VIGCRALIVDDERLARAELRTLLAAHPSITVSAEAATLGAASAAMKSQKFDLVFLDIRLGAGTGFDLLASIPPSCRIVFVTAYDAYAVQAFEVNALDYLLKPVHPERLATTICRLGHPAAEPTPPRRLTPDGVAFLRSGTSASFVKVASIACILADGDYSRVVTTDGRELLILRSLTEWETILPLETFVRVHRSAIANSALIARTARGRDGRWRLHIPALARPLVVSRRYGRRLG
jgi:two-component system, LytTR family, response regulator